MILILVGLGFIVIGPMIGFFLALPFYSGSITDMVNSLQSPAADPAIKIPLYIVQASATFFGLIVCPALFLAAERRSVVDFFRNYKVDFLPVVITVIAVIVFMAVNSVFIEWNANVHFPEFAKEFEQWAKEKEELAAEMTKFLTKFDSVGEVLIALIVIAVIPAFGEEIVFRGIIQNQLLRATNNIHVSIWFAAFLFSAIHFQFFGFVPRLLLGALFGYFYYWSGSLWFAVIAHFVNNGFSVLAMYFYQQGTVTYDLESPEALPITAIIFSALLTVALLYYFYKYFENRQSITQL
ncbi:CPBP family intramembrane glutamic endopeptidase [Chryseosolibacter indicus]|nr:CPBP family intramembrane glutamic endopeptidase [Chryseosolibacter indicus]